MKPTQLPMETNNLTVVIHGNHYTYHSPRVTRMQEIKESTAGFPQPANDVNQLQPIQQPFPVESSRSLDVGTEYIEHHPVQFVNSYGSRLPMSHAETTMSPRLDLFSGVRASSRRTGEIPPVKRLVQVESRS